MTHVLSPLSLGELLDRTFQLYRRHLVVFVGLLALPSLILLPLQLASLWYRTSNPLSLTSILMTFALIGLGLVVMSIAQAATVTAVARLYLGHSISISDAYAQAAGRVGSICILVILVGFACGLGLILFVVPGILLLLRWSLAVQVMVLEDETIRGSMSRSADLTSGDRLRIFGVYFLYFVLVMIISSLWQVPVVVATIAAGRASTNPPFWTQLVLIFGSFVTSSLVGPLLTIALSLVYYDERVRKEAFDLEHLMAQIDAPHVPGPSPA